jgi:hypothetical protein
MNTCILLPVQESRVQRGAGKHDWWRGYMTLLVVNHGIIKSIPILTTVIHQMTTFDVDKPWDCFSQEVKWMLAIRSQHSTLPALDLDHVHYLPPALQ